MGNSHLFAFAIASCFLIGLSLGLLGSGGSILTVPILVYLLGVDAKEAIAMSLVVVGITSAFALISHARSGNVNWKMGGIFGAAGMAGAFVGGILAGYISEHILMMLFALMTLATATAMLCRDSTSALQYERVPHDSDPENKAIEEELKDGTLPLWRIILDGFVVGVVTGMVGAGGGFLVVPALVFLGGLQMTEAIGTSLLVISMKCLAGYLGHASHVHIDLKLTFSVSCSAVLGSFLGGFGAELLPQATLRKTFAIFVLLIGALQLWKESSSLARPKA